MYTLRPAPVLAIYFYKNPKARIELPDILEITDQIRFPIYPDITVDSILDAVRANSCFEIDSEGFVTCPEWLTEIDLDEFTNRLPEKLSRELFERTPDAN